MTNTIRRYQTFIITHDHLGDSPCVVRTVTGPDYPQTFTLHDDDGILYFTGRAVDNGSVRHRFTGTPSCVGTDNGALIDAYEWGMAYAGTTQLRINNKVEIG
jgi:hypothetical protein